MTIATSTTTDTSTDTATDTATDTPPTWGEPVPRVRRVDINPLRDIHKGIRAALFAVTAAAGRADRADDLGVAALESEVRDVARLLADHAAHEDAHIDVSILDRDLADRIEGDHAVLADRMAWLVDLASAARLAAPGERRHALDEIHVELASFTSAYLSHQDMEERLVVPCLLARVGVEGVVAIHSRIVASMSPEQFTRGLVVMLPAISVDDRTEMLSGMRAVMPADVFAGVWSLAASVLAPEDSAALAVRLGI
jgi:hypothetical protein